MKNPANNDGFVRLALPSKGNLYEGTIDLLRSSGYKVRRAGDRQYEATIAGRERFRVLFMRPTDIVTQVSEGRCDLGVTGYDVYAERAGEAEDSIVVVKDLGYGGCRLVAAVPESWVDVVHALDLADLISEWKSSGKTFRVSTKYPGLVRSWFRRFGVFHYAIIESEGALELHPSLGIADVIVDLTSSGATLKENRLREIEGGVVLESSACLIGHAPSLLSLVEEGETGALALLLDAMDGTLESEGWLHIEAVGRRSETAGGGTAQASPAEGVVEHLGTIGGRQIVQGEVWTEEGASGWRVTALLPANRFAECRRPLARMGALRVIGLPVRSVFSREGESTFDRLRNSLAQREFP